MRSERRRSHPWIHERRRARFHGPFSRPSLSRCRFRPPHREGVRWVLPTTLSVRLRPTCDPDLAHYRCSSHACGVASGISLISGPRRRRALMTSRHSVTGRLIWHGATCSLAVAVGCVNSVTADLQGDSAFAADTLGPQVRRVRRGLPARAPPSQVPLTPVGAQTRPHTESANPVALQEDRIGAPPRGQWAGGAPSRSDGTKLVALADHRHHLWTCAVTSPRPLPVS